MEWTIVSVTCVMLTGFVVGFLSGLMGVGGGFLVTPVLVSIFGFPWRIAIGSSLCQMMGMGAAGARRHLRYGNVDVKLALFMTPFTILGGWVGDLLLVRSDETSITLGGRALRAVDVVVPAFYAVMLLVIAVLVIQETRKALKTGSGDVEPQGWLSGVRLCPFLQVKGVAGKGLSVPALGAVAFAAGILLGLLGIGAGVVLQPLMIYAFGIPTRVAVGSSLLMVVGSSLVVTCRKAAMGGVDPLLVALLLLSSPFGVQLGATACKRISSQRIRFIFSLVVVAALAIVLRELYQVLGAV